MKHMEQYTYIFLGILCFIIGAIGILIPILPTTPLILLSGALLLRGSPKMYDRFVHSKIYLKYSNYENIKKNKFKILIPVTILIIILCCISSSIIVKIILMILLIIKIIYFIWFL